MQRYGHIRTAGGSGTVLCMAEIGYEWERVAREIEELIGAGRLPAGAMLRGERAMAEEYGVSIDTVRRAVKDLRARGLVVTLPHKGTFVRHPED